MSLWTKSSRCDHSNETSLVLLSHGMNLLLSMKENADYSSSNYFGCHAILRFRRHLGPAGTFFLDVMLGRWGLVLTRVLKLQQTLFFPPFSVVVLAL